MPSRQTAPAAWTLTSQPLALMASAILALAGCATEAPKGAAPAATAPAAGTASVPSMAAAPVAPAARPPGAASAPTATSASATLPAPPAPGLPPPFAVVIRDAKKFDGLFTLYQKDEKVWIELKPEDFNKPIYFSPKIAQGIGENRILGGTMVGSYGSFGRSQVIEFQRVHTQVRMVAKNRQFRANAGTPEALSVAAGFSDSLLASSGVVSQPHPERKTVLVDAAPLFLADLLGVASSLQRAYRQGYAMDGRHTGFTTVRSLPDQVVFNVQAHFATPNLASAIPGAPPGAPVPTVPGTLPDARSLFIGLYYSLARLPEQAMAPRRADPRVGYFVTSVDDFSNDTGLTPRLRHVNRWRLDKKDPTAEVSEPVKPIVFWIDRTVPLKYRDAVTRGILEWNKAFDKIGFKGAVVARQQPDDASFDTLDVGVASVRFISSAQPAFDGFGPSITDPRSGEILDADIVLDSNAARNMRGLRLQVINRSELRADGTAAEPGGSADLARLMQFGNPLAAFGPGAQSHANAHAHTDGSTCEFGAFAAEQYGYALDVLESRGDIAPDSPLADEFAVQRIFAVTTHEVGHALGLRHNFRASRAYNLAQLADPAFTAANGTTASVMDYAALNLPPPGVPFERYGDVHRSALGPYDYWAIEYAYKPIAPADEENELRRIAARSNEPALAFGTDEDAGLGIDPESLTFDLGDDPVAYANSRFAIAHDLLQRQETRQLSEHANYAPLRRAVRYAVRDVAAAAGVLARQIGGLRTLRDYPGSGRDPLQPVPGSQQRAALEALTQNVLATDSLRLSPALQRRLAPDYDQRSEDRELATDYSMTESVIAVQRALLGQLMSDNLAARILDNEGKFEPASAGKPADAFHLSELYSRLTRTIWTELDKPATGISAARRELQREHLNRLATQLLRPAVQSRADARALLRAQARELLPRLQAAAKRPGWDAQASAHLADAADTLAQALAAPMQRGSV